MPSELKQIKATDGIEGQVATINAAGFLVPGDFSGVNAEAVVKVWIRFTGTGTIAIDDSFNVSSIVDNGTGNYTINADIDFDNTDWAPSASSDLNDTVISTITVGSVIVTTHNSSGSSVDAARVIMHGFGDMVNLSVGGSAPGVKVDSLCKGWVTFDGTGTIAIDDSFNVSSLTDNGTGDYNVNWDVDFDNADYSPSANSIDANTAFGVRTAGSVRLICSNSSFVLTDSAAVFCQAFGDNPIALSIEAGFNFGDVEVLSDAATVTPAVGTNTNLFKLATTQNFTLNTPTGIPVGKSYKADLFVTQDGTGSRLLTVGSGWLVDGGTDPVLTTDANAVDWLVMTYDGTNFYLGLAMGDAS